MTFPDIPADDIPITLKEACRVFFRDQVKPATLRAEALRGNLAVMRIGRADFVTPAAMREMMKKCHVQPKAHGSSSSRSASATTPVSSASERSGSSATARSLDALAAASSIAEELKRGSPRISGRSSSLPAAKVISLESRSRRC